MTPNDRARLQQLIRGCVAARPYVESVVGEARNTRIREVVTGLLRRIFGAR